jgi:hypothetical protein
MDLVVAFVADRHRAVAVESRQRALDLPAVAARPLHGLDPLAGDPDLDPSTGERPAAAGDIVRLVGVKFVRAPAPLPGGAHDRRDGVEQLFEHRRLVAVGPGQADRQRNPPQIGDEVALGAAFATNGRVRSHRPAHLVAGTLAASSAAWLQSILSASPRRSSSARWIRSQTPSVCQSRMRRQHVTPLPLPSSRVSISQGRPLRSTTRMPVRRARSGTRRRQPFGFGGAGGYSGSTITHHSSGSSGLATIHLLRPPRRTRAGFERRS